MRLKIMICLSALALGDAYAAPVYTINLSHAAQVVDAQLPAGEYSVELQRGQAIFKRGKAKILVPVTVEKNANVVPYTIIEIVGTTLHVVHIAGTDKKLVFPLEKPAREPGDSQTARTQYD